MAYILSMATLKARGTKKIINRENDFLNQNSVLEQSCYHLNRDVFRDA